MRLPSISQAAAEARETFARFPFAILDAVLGTACALVLIDHTGPYGPTVLTQILFAAVLGFPLLTALAITSEKLQWGRVLSLGAQLAVLALVVVYATSVPREIMGAPAVHGQRLLMLALGSLLLIFTLPFLGHKSELGHWNFCETLVIRAVTAAIYAVVLYAGLAIALAALDKLFGVDVPGKRYLELWVFINGIFTTWFSLVGVPKEFERLDAEREYPKALKIFSQYILFPLVLVYLVILYAYLGKILLAWDWPKGWVSALILGFAATGLASMLLLHPIRNRTENRWIDTASRWFYAALVPLIVMLFLAVLRRVSEYGITEERYLGFAAVLWLGAVAVYFILSRKKKILFLAASLCVVVFAVSIGPWSMFAVSEKSQVARLEKILVDQHMLAGGRVQRAHEPLPFEPAREISSIIGYLADFHGFAAIEPWFGESLKEDPSGNVDVYKAPSLVVRMMGVEYVQRWQASPGGEIILKADEAEGMKIEGYERLLRRRTVSKGNKNREFTYQEMTLRISEDLRTTTVSLSPQGRTTDSLQIDLMPLAGRLAAEYAGTFADKIPPEKMAITAEVGTRQVKMFFPAMTLKRHEGKLEVISFELETAYK